MGVFTLPQRVFTPVWNMTELATNYGSISWELQKPWDDTINQHTERANSIAVLCRYHQRGDQFTSSPLPTWVSDQLQGGRDIKKDQPLRCQHLLPPARKQKLCSFDVKTEFTLNPSPLNQAGNSVSFSYGNTVSTRAVHGEKWFSRRLELSQRQGTVSSASKALTEQKLEPWLYWPNSNHFLGPQGWREQKSSTPCIVHGVSLTLLIQL